MHRNDFMKIVSTIVWSMLFVGFAVAQTPNVVTYTIKKGDTMWSIAQANGISVDELVAANPELQQPDAKLKKGRTVVIPLKVEVQEATKPQARSISVGVILPLTSKTSEAYRCLEFYRGLLMGADEVRKSGTDITFFTYDENPADPTLAATFAKLENHKADVVFGPLYPSHFDDLAAFARKVKRPVIVPFSSKVAQVAYNPYIYELHTPERYLFQHLVELFFKEFKNTHVVFLSSEKGNQQSFAQQLRSRIAAEGFTTSTLPLNFTPEAFQKVVIAGKRTLFVPDDDRETTLNEALKSIKALRVAKPGFELSLLGYPDWFERAAKNASDLYYADTYLFGDFYHNIYSQATKDFERSYQRWFGTALLPVYPRAALLGYDAAKQIFETLRTMQPAEAQNSGDEAIVITEKLSEAALQSPIRFARVNQTGGYYNANVWFLHYKRNHTVDRLE